MSSSALTTGLAADQVELMLDVLKPAVFGRNSWIVGRSHPAAIRAQALIASGFMTSRPIFGGEAVDLAVTTTGARVLVKAGALTIADLASDVEKMLARAIAARRHIERHPADGRDWDGADVLPDEPYARVAAAILLKRGDIEQRGPVTEKERAHCSPDALFIRASDKAMGIVQ